MINKTVSYIQIALLALAVIAGGILIGNPDATLKALHRAAGLVGGIAGIAVLVLNRNVSSLPPKISGGLAVLATFIAGYAGSSLKTTADYGQMFTLMRVMGVMALILAIVTLALLRRHQAKPQSPASL